MSPTRDDDMFWGEFQSERLSVASPTMQQSIAGNGGGSGCGSHGQVSQGSSLEQGKGGPLKRKKGSGYGSCKPSSVKNGIRKQNATSEATDNETVRADVGISAPSHTKQRKLVSNVWKGFERVIRDGKVRAICKICKKEFDGSSKKGTTHLNNHLKRCEKRRNRDKDQELISSIERGDLTAPSVVRGNVVFDQERCRLDLARMIIRRQCPLNIAEHEFFKTFSNSFQLTLELPSQEDIMAEILHIYQKEKEEICTYLDKLSCGFGLAIDLWKDDFKKSSYMCFTLRFIDDDWELKEKILAVRKLEYKFDEKAFCTTFESVFSSWNIRGKLCSVSVNNNCDDIDVFYVYLFMLSYYHKLFHWQVAPISCKSLSKPLVEAGLELIDDILQKIQKSSEYVIATHLRKQMFQAAVNQVKLQDAEVSQDVPTSSNPFLMLEEAMRLRKVFCDLGENDRDFNFNLSTEEWDKAIVISKCLKAIYDDLSNLAGTKSLTTNVYFARLLHIWKLFPCESEYDYLRLMANTMKSKFIDYWKKGNCDWDCAVALILDPQLKTSFLASSPWQLLYGSRADWPWHNMVDHFIDLYYNYESDPSDPASSASLSSDTLDASPESELDRYLAEPTWPSDDKFDILGWWRINTPNFPTLARIARDFLAKPMPNVLSYSALGTEITRINKAFNDPDPEFVEALICAQDWLETPKR